MPPKKNTRSNSNINNPITKLIKQENTNTPIEFKKIKKHPNKIDDCIKCNKAFISKYSSNFPGYINTCDSCNELSNKQCDSYEGDGNNNDEKNKHNSSSCCENNDDSFSNTFDNLFFASIISKLNNINPVDNRNNSNKNKNKDNKRVHGDSAILIEDETDLEYEWLGLDIKDIDDLIRIGKTYNPKKRKRYNLNLHSLNMLVEPLIELKNMIGMTDVKKIIFDQIIYYLQNLDDKNVDMLHTVIVGPPGVGKTQLTHIIAKIYNKLGFLKTDNVICAKRDDLIGQYVGQTAIKTRKVLDSALGGVLLLR